MLGGEPPVPTLEFDSPLAFFGQTRGRGVVRRRGVGGGHSGERTCLACRLGRPRPKPGTRGVPDTPTLHTRLCEPLRRGSRHSKRVRSPTTFAVAVFYSLTSVGDAPTLSQRPADRATSAWRSHPSFAGHPFESGVSASLCHRTPKDPSSLPRLSPGLFNHGCHCDRAPQQYTL